TYCSRSIICQMRLDSGVVSLRHGRVSLAFSVYLGMGQALGVVSRFPLDWPTSELGKLFYARQP
ncbi:MAG TPA: hypothetical protein VMU53_01600, partial [Candidatus Sulfotelmatobacter sp.]|nr:hypothetical protein [Candidatus Sulfotelmatobacter sp.]